MDGSAGTTTPPRVAASEDGLIMGLQQEVERLAAKNGELLLQAELKAQEVLELKTRLTQLEGRLATSMPDASAPPLPTAQANEPGPPFLGKEPELLMQNELLRLKLQDAEAAQVELEEARRELQALRASLSLPDVPPGDMTPAEVANLLNAHRVQSRELAHVTERLGEMETAIAKRAQQVADLEVEGRDLKRAVQEQKDAYEERLDGLLQSKQRLDAALENVRRERDEAEAAKQTAIEQQAALRAQLLLEQQLRRDVDSANAAKIEELQKAAAPGAAVEQASVAHSPELEELRRDAVAREAALQAMRLENAQLRADLQAKELEAQRLQAAAREASAAASLELTAGREEIEQLRRTEQAQRVLLEEKGAQVARLEEALAAKDESMQRQQAELRAEVAATQTALRRETDAQIRQLEVEAARARTSAEAAAAERDAAKAESQDWSQRMDSLRDASASLLSAANARADEAEVGLAAARRELEGARAVNEELSAEREALQYKLDAASDKLHSMAEQHEAAVQAQRQALEARVQGLEQAQRELERSAGDKERVLERLRGEIGQLTDQIAGLRAQVAAQVKELAEAGASSHRLRAELAEGLAQQQQKDTLLSEREAALGRLAAEHQAEQLRAADLATREAASAAQVQRLRQEVDELRAKEREAAGKLEKMDKYKREYDKASVQLKALEQEKQHLLDSIKAASAAPPTERPARPDKVPQPAPEPVPAARSAGKAAAEPAALVKPPAADLPSPARAERTSPTKPTEPKRPPKESAKENAALPPAKPPPTQASLVPLESHSTPPVVETPRAVCVAFSGFKDAQAALKQELTAIIVRLGGAVNDSSEFDSKITHVVTPPHSKTMKSLAAALTGRWLMQDEWVRACDQAGRFVPEGDYGKRSAARPFQGKVFAFSAAFSSERGARDNTGNARTLIELGNGSLVTDEAAADFVLVPNSLKEKNARHLSWNNFLGMIGREEAPAPGSPKGGKAEGLVKAAKEHSPPKRPREGDAAPAADAEDGDPRADRRRTAARQVHFAATQHKPAPVSPKKDSPKKDKAAEAKEEMENEEAATPSPKRKRGPASGSGSAPPSSSPASQDGDRDFATGKRGRKK